MTRAVHAEPPETVPPKLTKERPEEANVLHEIGRLLAAGYLRGLAQRGEATRAFPAGQESLISVDSCGQQSVNGVDKNGERDA